MEIIDKFSIDKLNRIGGFGNENALDYIIQTILGLTDEEADNFDVEEWERKKNELRNVDKRRYNKLEISGLTFRYINTSNISLGEFIDISNFLSLKRIDMLMALLWRLELEPGNDIDVGKLEKYPLPLQHRANILKNASIKYFYQIENDIEELMKTVKTAFPMLYSNEVDETPDDISKLNQRELILWKAEKLKKDAYKKEAWNFLLYKLSDGDITKWDIILKQPWWRAFTVLKLMKINEKGQSS